MPSALEKARRDPGSMKARILGAARCVFGQNGYHGTTTRMIAKAVGIDISTLYYHWGEKSDLYEAVVLDVNEDLRNKLGDVEKTVRGLSLGKRMDIAIEVMTDYLFDHPEISNLALFRYFGKTRDESVVDIPVPETISDIARSMGLCRQKKDLSNIVRMEVLAMINSIHNFVSGEAYFRSMLGVSREEYIPMVKQTLKFVLIPAFTGRSQDGGS
jgi:AcrR family transcriptional regulator